MNRNNLIALIAGSLAVLLLICILMVGVLDGIWPWDGVDAYGRLISSQYQNGIGPRPSADATEPASGNNTSGNNASGDQGGQSSDTPAVTTPVISEVTQNTTPPKQPDISENDVSIEIDGVTVPSTDNTGNTGSSNSTESTESTESTGSTESTESSTPATTPDANDYDVGFSFDDLLKDEDR